MAGIGEMFSSLFGGGGGPQMPAAAPPVTSYPTPEDAEYARRYGFGYGSGNEAYIQGENARVLGRTFQDSGRQPWTPVSAEGMGAREAANASTSEQLSRNLDLTDPANVGVKDTLGTSLAQAALAANRSPVASLGFDPGRAALDTRITDSNYGGLYDPKTDSMYVSMRDDGDQPSIVHESMHRGLAKLKADPNLKELFRSLPSNEELLVRYLMYSQAGDPEGGRGKISDQQRSDAKYIYGGSGLYKKQLEAIDYAAQEAIKNRRPGGPR